MSTHAHEIMHFMLESTTPFTRESLAEALAERFGEKAEFHSCSAEGMSISGVIRFLESRGKFTPKGDGFVTDENKICKH